MRQVLQMLFSKMSRLTERHTYDCSAAPRPKKAYRPRHPFHASCLLRRLLDHGRDSLQTCCAAEVSL